MKKKKVIVIIIVALIILAGIGTVIFFLINKKSNQSDEMVYVESVADITGYGVVVDNRYMGVVESQETKKVDKAADKTVKEIFVEVGDEVKEGDALFEYDSEEMTLKLKQLELELTSINTSITTANQQIASLAAERDTVEADYKMEYTAQIQSLQAQVNQYNYDASAKQLEIDRQKSAIENSVVFAPMDGIVKEINTDAEGTGSEEAYYYGGDENAKSFMSIMALGDYRIKGTASELNVRSMYEGQPVIIRSRMDESITWTGTITTIDLEHPDNNNNNMYYYDSSGTGTSNYPFYITLDSIEGLILGQHVYVEMDYGQNSSKDGIWLYESYIMNEDKNSYVWAEDKDGRIEKRKVTLGDYDEDMMQYEIVSGITVDDNIAWPEDRIREGMKATHNYEDVIQYEEVMDDEVIDGEFIDGEIIDGDVMDGEIIDYDMDVDYGVDDLMPEDDEVPVDVDIDAEADSGEEAGE